MRAFTKQLLGAATLALTSQAVHAAVLIPITPPPDAVSAVVFGINNDNVIAGAWRDAGGIEHGFTGPLNGVYRTFDVGGTSTGTEPRAIGNDGSINGFATDPGFVLGSQFLRRPNGTILPITKDGVTLDGVAHGVIRDPTGLSGIVSVGDYADPTFSFFSAYLAINGTYRRDIVVETPFDELNTRPRGINRAGTIAGFIETTGFVRHGFIKKGNRVQIIDANRSGTTVLEGINRNEFASGQVADDAGNPHSFVYNNATGQVSTIVIDDGSTFQQAWGINDARLVTVSTSIGVSYVFCPKPPDQCPAGGFEIPDGPTYQIEYVSPHQIRGPRVPTRGAIQ